MRRSFPALAVAFFACAGAAAAQSAPAPAPSASAIPAGPQPPDPKSWAFGSFGGARTRLAEQGISLRGHYVAESAANVSGGLQQGTAYASEVMFGADIDLSRAIRNSGLGTFHATFTEREGSSLSQNAIGNLLTVQEIYGDGLTPHLTELSYDQPFLKDAIDVSLGRIITENDFADSSKYWGGALYCDYQNNGICGTPIAAPIDSGYDAYPSSAWGVRVRGNPSKSVYLEGGFYQVNTLYGTRGHGLSLGLAGDTGSYFPLEAGFTLNDAKGSMVGNVRFGGYYDTSVAKDPGSQLVRFDPGDAAFLNGLPTPSYRGRSGEWLQFDHLLAGGSGAHDPGIAFFAAAEYGDPQTSLLSFFGDAGIVRHGTFHGRPDDLVSLGYAYANVNPRLRDVESLLQSEGYSSVPSTGQEQILEANYNVAVTPWLVLRPGAQYVFHPSGIATIKNAFVLDLSTTISF
jgi:porin